MTSNVERAIAEVRRLERGEQYVETVHDFLEWTKERDNAYRTLAPQLAEALEVAVELLGEFALPNDPNVWYEDYPIDDEGVEKAQLALARIEALMGGGE